VHIEIQTSAQHTILVKRAYKTDIIGIKIGSHNILIGCAKRIILARAQQGVTRNMLESQRESFDAKTTTVGAQESVYHQLQANGREYNYERRYHNHKRNSFSRSEKQRVQAYG